MMKSSQNWRFAEQVKQDIGNQSLKATKLARAKFKWQTKRSI